MDHNNNMEYRINLEKQNQRNDQVTELLLDNCRASHICGLTDEFVKLETLSMINVGLSTLDGFPKLPELKRLELSDNRLTGGLHLLHGCPKLQHLNLSGNRIKDLEALEPLKEFQKLVTLDLYNCDVTKADDYRQKCFELIPNLHSLDGYDRNDREVADSDESDDDVSDAEAPIQLDVEDDGEAVDDEAESSEYDEEESVEEVSDIEMDEEDEDMDEDDDEEEDDSDEELDQDDDQGADIADEVIEDDHDGIEIEETCQSDTRDKIQDHIQGDIHEQLQEESKEHSLENGNEIEHIHEDIKEHSYENGTTLVEPEDLEIADLKEETQNNLREEVKEDSNVV